MKLRSDHDAFGRILREAYLRGEAREVLERDDGCSDEFDAREYLGHPRTFERRSLRCAKGRVLDIGCGAGRHALWLQRHGHAVVGIDVSPGAVRLARKRGVRHAHRMSMTEVGPRLGVFDTITMLGNNFALVGTEKRARWLLRRFKRITSPDAVILAGTQGRFESDPDRPIRVRIRHRRCSTPWFDLLLVSPRGLGRVVDGTGWRIERTFHGSELRYVAVLCR